MDVLIRFLLQPAADAFLQVGVFVALMLGAFGYLRHRLGDRLLAFIAARWRTAPLIGAALGVTPGCGGAIVIMPLYLRGTVTFGTVVAALVATMGDSSFVLFAASPSRALQIHALLLVAGVASGYAVDAIGLEPRRALAPEAGRTDVAPVGHVASVGAAQAFPSPRGPRDSGPLEAVPLLLWWIVGLGLVVAMPVLAGVTDGAALARHFAGVDPYLVVGTLGAGIALAAHLRSRGRDGAEADDGAAPRDIADVLRHGARETAFVTVWVTVAYVVTTGFVDAVGLNMAVIVGATGVLGVVLGAVVGLVPGCAIQVLLTGLYATGMVPLPTLVANAVSQDGDALFPLMLMNRRAAVVASVVTTVPAVVIGAAVLLVW